MIYNLTLFCLRILIGIHSEESPLFLLFSRDPITPLRKLLLPTIRYQWDEGGPLDIESIPTLTRRNITISRQKSVTVYPITRSPNKFKVSDPLHIKRHSKSAWDSKWESGFCAINFYSCSAILQNTLSGKSRNANTEDMHLANTLDIL